MNEGDNLERLYPNFSNYDNVIKDFRVDVATAAKIPFNILMKDKKTASLSLNSDTEFEIYYNMVNDIQETMLRPVIARFLELISAYKFNSQECSFRFNPLWQMSLQEELNCKEKQANIDKIYIESSPTLTPSILTSRFGGKSYSYDTKIEPGEIEKLKALNDISGLTDINLSNN